MRRLVWILSLVTLLWARSSAIAQQDDVRVRFEGDEITEVVEISQFATDSREPSVGGEPTIDEETLEEYAEQIFVGSIWTLAEDGTATFEFGQQYDLDDFGIDEASAILAGSWQEKRNGELAVEISYTEDSADFSQLIILNLTADIAVDGTAATAQVYYSQIVIGATATVGTSDSYIYELELAFVPLGDEEEAAETDVDADAPESDRNADEVSERD